MIDFHQLINISEPEDLPQIDYETQQKLLQWLWKQSLSPIDEAEALFASQIHLPNDLHCYMYHFIRHPNLDIAFDAFAVMIHDILLNTYDRQQQNLQIAQKTIQQEQINASDLTRVLRFDQRSESVMCIFLVRYHEFAETYFRFSELENRQVMDLALTLAKNCLKNRELPYVRFSAGLLLLHLKCPNIVQDILPLLELSSGVDLSWFDYEKDTLSKPDVYRPEWLKSGIFQAPQELEKREVILRALIDYAPEKVAPHVIAFLKAWEPLPFMYTLSQHYQDEFAPGLFNRVIHACIMCNVSADAKEVQSLWSVLPTYSHTELLAWLYHLHAQGQAWDHQNHHLLKQLLHHKNPQVSRRAKVIAQHFEIK